MTTGTTQTKQESDRNFPHGWTTYTRKDGRTVRVSMCSCLQCTGGD